MTMTTTLINLKTERHFSGKFIVNSEHLDKSIAYI